MKRDIDAYIQDLAKPPPPGEPCAVPLPGTERPNRTPIYRHWRFRDRPLQTSYDPAHQSLHDLFEDSAKRNPNKRCLGTRHWDSSARRWQDKFEWITYAETARRKNNLGAGIVEIHQRINHPKDKYGVGIWSQNRAEWMIAELAFSSQSLYSVALYETLGPDTTEYITNHAELSCIVCSLPHIPTLLQLAPRIPCLKLIVSMDPLDDGEQEGYSKSAVLNDIARQHGIQIYSMAEVEEIGAQSGRPVRPPVWDDLATISYTSGTTGPPKGVVLTSGNLVSANAASQTSLSVVDGDMHISYLPLAHIYGRLVDGSALTVGASVGFFRGDVTGLIDDMKLLGPSALMSVPRIFNRINTALRAGTVEAEGFKGSLSRHIVNAKRASMKLPNGQATNKHMLYDRFWTPKVKAAVGLHRCKNLISGSAQLDPDVQEFLRAALGVNFNQGYGLTETFAVGTFQPPGDYSIGTIGGVMSCLEACVESVPEFEYTVEDKPNPRGELCLRGPSLFKEYYKNEEETKKAIDPDGWFHTGDIVELDKLGRFWIVDRKKNVLKLSQGEYVSPERLENVFMANTSLVASAFVHGDGKQSTLVGIFGVDPATFAPFASKIIGAEIDPADIPKVKDAAKNAKVKTEFIKILDKIARGHKFNSFERLRNVYLDVEPFTIENELLTPTMKLKRPQAVRAFRKEIDQMYEEISSQAPTASKL